MKDILDARILMVDDTELNLRVLAGFLKQAGFRNYQALQDSRRFLGVFRQFQPDLVLLDLMMPEVDGFEILRLLHSELDVTDYLPVVVLTADGTPDTKRRSLAAGASDFLSKPLDATEVTLRIRNLLHSRKLHVELSERNHCLEQAVAERTAALRLSEERYALACSAANDGLWDWDLAENATYYSARWKAILGYADNELSNAPEEWWSRVHVDDLPYLRQLLDAVIEGQTDHLHHEYRMTHKNGAVRWVLTRGVPVRDESNQLVRLAGSQSDVTARKLAEEQLFHDAFHDPLTSLANRALFMDRLTQRLRTLHRHPDRPFATLFIDLNRFKLVNDSLGHRAGDELLVKTAHRLQATLRSVDTVARLGGDEFAVLLDHVADEAEAANVGNRLAAAVATPSCCDGHEVSVTASIGIAIGSPDHRAAEDVVRDADMAMYRAKALQSPVSLIFDPSMLSTGPDLLRLERDLRRAVDRNELVVHFQPIYSLASEDLVGFESLVRWQHPERGLISPGEFIHAAEETGQILPIGEFVLRSACESMARWRELRPDYDLKLSVNVSPRQFNMPDVVPTIREILRATGLSPACLLLEITESTVMQNPEHAVRKLEHLRAFGVGLSIDDFGIGYSSLRYLQQFPVSHLKIDRAFIRCLESQKKDVELVRIMLQLARSLGLRVVAEGIETESQFRLLREMACPYGQGYYFSAPIDGHAAEAMVAELPESRFIDPTPSAWNI